MEEKLGCFGVQTLKSFFLQKWLELGIVGGRKTSLFWFLSTKLLNLVITTFVDEFVICTNIWNREFFEGKARLLKC